MAAGFFMEARALAAHLAHVTHDQQARPRQLGQHVNSSLHGVGIGVVSVIDQGQPTPRQFKSQRARAPLDGLKGGQAGGNAGQRDASGQCAGRSGQGVADVVPARNRQDEFQRAARRLRADLPAVHRPVGLGGDVG